MKRRIVSIVIAAMTLILCAVPATAEPGSSETLYSDGLVTSESAVYSLVRFGSDRSQRARKNDGCGNEVTACKQPWC